MESGVNGARYSSIRSPREASLRPSPCRTCEAVPCAEGGPLAVDEVSMDTSTHCCKLRFRSSNPAGRSPTPPRRRMTAALRRWGGLEGFTPPHQSRRGQRLPTDSVPSPAPRVSASIRFAVRSLSGAMDRETTKAGACVGTSSTAAAVPLPLIGEGLSAVEIEARLTMSGAALSHSALSLTSAYNAPRREASLQVTSYTAERSPFPSRGRLKCGRN